MAPETITGNESLEELQNLLEVMQKRLTIIDEKKTQTRPEIYAKVRAEYVANIEKIQNLIIERGGDLEEALNRAVVDRDTLEARYQELRDILDEMELRLAIGEIDEAAKAQMTQEYVEEMKEIEVKLASIAQKIDNYQKLMQVSVRTAARPTASPAQALPPKPEPRPAMQPKPAPVAATPSQPPLPRPQPKPTVSIPEPPKTSPAPATKPQVPPISKPIPKPAVTPSAPASVQIQPEPQELSTPTNEIDELEKQFASILGESLSQQSTVNPTGIPTQTTTQMEPPKAAQEFTEDTHEGEIKCPKCGTFNRADNWYCEKCGNELISAQDLLGM